MKTAGTKASANIAKKDVPFFGKEKRLEFFRPRPGVIQAKSEAPETPDDRHLKSNRFKGDEILEACFDGEQDKYLRNGSQGKAIEKVQLTSC
ncbi:hypothetical protein ACQ86N_07805 [Puia sp. P3]|uniref:hypothetical protein n=1 Tax=Puia sp. P3 TaxID=3423952 RepID=UPI003D66B6C6